jgi:hypothetical protein
MRRRFLGLIALVAACGGPGARDLVALDQVPGTSSAPKIERVSDLGDLPPLPARGPMPAADSDDQFAIGELVLIEGRALGKLPALRIGGAPVQVVARTGSGAILARVPPGIDTGPAEIEVSHPGGRDATTIDVERHVVIVNRTTGAVHVVGLGRAMAARVRASFPIPGAVAAAISHDGQVAYVAASPASTGGRAAATATASLHVIALTAAGGPKLVHQQHLPLPSISALAAAHQAPVAAVAGGGKLLLLDLGVPRTPAIGRPVPLVGDARALAIHPQGQRLVALSPQDNMLTPVELAGEAPQVEQPVDLLPGEREPMAVDLEFAPGGHEVWAVCGDQPTTVAGGTHPTRLVVVSWETGAARVHRTVELAEVSAPLGLAVGRRESVGSATAIRSTRRRAPIVVASVSPEVWSRDPATPPSKLPALGRLLAADLDGGAQVLASQIAVYGSPAITHDLSWVVSPTVRLLRGESGTRFELGLSLQPLAAGSGAYRFVHLSEGSPAGLTEPPTIALSP